VTFDVHKIRNDFPILGRNVYGRPLVYLDNAATTQKPEVVIKRIASYYENENCNIHRGVHKLGQMATLAYENARKTVQQFLRAKSSTEIIFTRGTTESINLVAATYARKNIRKGDEIVISAMEHHANIVPWQFICEENQARLRVIPVTDKGELDMAGFRSILSEKTKIVSVNWISNALGTVNPVEEIIQLAHHYGAVVLLDAAQAVAHMPVDVIRLDCDFMAFSGHKIFAPMGIGVLYGKEKLLENMPPYMGGGEMIKKVTFEKTTFNELPFKFEAGTPNVEGVLGLEAALQYLAGIDADKAADYEDQLLAYATEKMLETNRLRVIGQAKRKKSILSFLIGDHHPFDVGAIIDHLGVAVRTGHHCTQPLMDRFGIPGTVRASFSIYNTFEEIDILAESCKKAAQMLD